MQPADMLILQKEQSPTAQQQQIILYKSSFPHLQPLSLTPQRSTNWCRWKLKDCFYKYLGTTIGFYEWKIWNFFWRWLFIHPFVSCNSAAIPLCNLVANHTWIGWVWGVKLTQTDRKHKCKWHRDGGNRVTWHVCLTSQHCPLVSDLHWLLCFSLNIINCSSKLEPPLVTIWHQGTFKNVAPKKQQQQKSTILC